MWWIKEVHDIMNVFYSRSGHLIAKKKKKKKRHNVSATSQWSSNDKMYTCIVTVAIPPISLSRAMKLHVIGVAVVRLHMLLYTPIWP